jgi:lysozyme family protein
MQVDYQPFIDRVIQKYEGGYGWSRNDPGGPTKYGITCYDLAEHRHLKMTSMAAWAPVVRDMSLAEAEVIYQDKYANGVNFSILPAGADCCVLDYAINSGVSRALLVTKALLRAPATKIDTTTATAIEAYGVQKFIAAMNAERLSFMHAIKGGAMWREYGHGWGNRVADLTAYSDHLAAVAKDPTLPAAPPVAPDLTKVVTPKATHVAKTAGGITAGGVVSVPTTMHFSGVSHAYVAAAALGILVVGVGYEAWQASKTAAANAKVVLPAGA